MTRENEGYMRWALNSIIESKDYLDDIRVSLKRRNAIEALKELHNIGALPDEEYKKYLIELINNEGFKLTE